MTIELYELCGSDPEIRFSPFVWRTRMALAHKGLDFTSIPWRFTEKDKIGFTGQKLVPVIRDEENVVSDSWAIAEYLEKAYPDRPSLFGGPEGKAGVIFFGKYVESIFPLVAPLVLFKVWEMLDSVDQDYFRETREARFGKALEDVRGDEEKRIDALRAGLSVFRKMLSQQPFAGGETPLYSDHLLFGSFQWIRSVAGTSFLEKYDPVAGWIERMLDSYGGHARSAKICG